MKWLELSVGAPPEYVEPLSVIFHRYGHGGVAIEEAGGYNPDEGETVGGSDQVILRTYLPVDSTTESRKEGIRVAVALVSLLCPLSPLEERVVEEGEWMETWKSHFSVMHIGRIVVCPAWMEHQALPGEVVIKIDPGMAFGTGYHPTTHMCLLELEQLVSPGVRVLDVGTGSGILAMAAALLGSDYVLGLDTDPVAVKTARDNVLASGLQGAVRVQVGTLGRGGDPSEGFGLVVANLYTKVVLEIAQELLAQVAPGGRLVLSGIIAERSHEVEARMSDVGWVPVRKSQEGDWVVLVGAPAEA